MSGLNGFLNGETEYEVVAASQTAQVLGGSGAAGDYLSHLVIDPTTSTPGSVTLIDGATTVLTLTPPSSPQPFTVAIGATSKEGSWKITTAAGVTVMAVGNFT